MTNRKTQDKVTIQYADNEEKNNKDTKYQQPSKKNYKTNKHLFQYPKDKLSSSQGDLAITPIICKYHNLQLLFN